MPPLQVRQASLLSQLFDLWFPATADGPAASELDVIPFVLDRLASPWGAGLDRYLGEPFEPETAGFVRQGRESPAQVIADGLGIVETFLAEHGVPAVSDLDQPLRQRLVEGLRAGALGHGSAEFFWTARQLLLEGLFGLPGSGPPRPGALWLSSSSKREG